MVMRRRFSRRRKRTDEGRTTPIEPQWLTRAGATPALEGATLEPAQPEDVPTSFALVGVAQRGDEQRIVAVSPSSGGDALFAGLVAAARSEGDGTAVSAFAPSWDAASRRRLGALARFEPAPRALTVPTAAGEPEPIAAEPVGQPIWFEPDAVAAQASTPEARALFARALEAFRGLAAKHAGAVRAAADVAELVIMARPVATLRADGARIVLEILEPNRNAQPLTEAGVSEAMDRLEGGVRKRLNDRRTRDGEDGLRGRWIAAAESHAGLRFARRWPFSGAAAALDVAGVTADGQAVVAATREQFTLHSLGQVLDAALLAEPWIPGALAAAGAPLLPTRPRLTLIAQSFDGAAQAVLGHLGLPVSCYEIGSTEGSLRLLSELDAAVAKPAPREARREGGGNRPPRRDRQEPRERGEAGGRPARAEGGEAVEGDGAAERNGEGGPRRRRSRGRRRRGGERRPAEGGGAAAPEEVTSEDLGLSLDEPQIDEPQIDELSLFDLGDDAPDDADGSRRRRRGRGRRGRGRRGGEEGAPSGAGESTSAASAEEADSAPGSPGDDEPEIELDDEGLVLSPDAPDPDEVEAEVAYEDEEEEPLTELDRVRLERERRRRARDAATTPVVATEQEGASTPEESRALPRGRAAILAHADRASIAAAVLLARDIRQVEGIWVYPQEDLMTFFRGVATDLREQTPIFVIGFAAKPVARDAIQAAALYRDRIVWFDHHEWPPEDVVALREAIGGYHVRVEPGAGSSLPLVLPECTRRSRFSEKLVDLVTGRFSHHDFQRWGRRWWWKLGDIASRPGERRSDLEMLLAGRPSDLAKEAERADDPPAPLELAYVAERDFRLVHFAGLGMVVATVPAELDPYLTLRIARERYGAVLSLARTEGDDLFVLAADDVQGRRAVDLSGMLEHLSEKFAWVLPARDEDHVARFRVRDLASQPERLDELVAEIGMGRSVLEG